MTVRGIDFPVDLEVDHAATQLSVGNRTRHRFAARASAFVADPLLCTNLAPDTVGGLLPQDARTAALPAGMQGPVEDLTEDIETVVSPQVAGELRGVLSRVGEDERLAATGAIRALGVWLNSQSVFHDDGD